MYNLARATILGAMISMALCVSAQTVTVDNYFNKETRKTSSGDTESYHYLWTDTTMSGFSIFGEKFKVNGASSLATLHEAPTLENLKNTAIYIIVDPDHTADSPAPNYMDNRSAVAIESWVRSGGVLLLLANDKDNADLDHLNILTRRFGFTFTNDIILKVRDDAHFDDGGVSVAGIGLFKSAKYIFIKNASAIAIKGSRAVPVLKTKDGKNVMVSVKHGKGAVLAVGDPWLYNEYTNGRLPAKFDNDKAAADVVQWLLAQRRNKR